MLRHDPTARALAPRFRTLVALLLAAALCLSTQASAETPTEPEAENVDAEKKKADKKEAKPIRLARKTVLGEVSSETKEGEEEPFPLSANLIIETSIGIGTFVAGDQNNSSVATTFWPILSYNLGDNMSLSAAITGTAYHLNDYATTLEDGEFLVSDLYMTFGHSKLFHDKDLGLSIAGYFRLYFPTSLASQFQNRVLSMRPYLITTLTQGPVTIRYTLMFMKYFSTSTVPSIDCEDFAEGCIEGREPTGYSVGGGFESERQGGEVFLPSGGVFSFYVANALDISVELYEGLSLAGSIVIYNIFGTRSYDVDQFSSPYARAGRSQVDRLISSIELEYQPIKHFAVALGFTTDSVQPFGADGKGLVIFDTSRAPDNISSLFIRLTGSI